MNYKKLLPVSALALLMFGTNTMKAQSIKVEGEIRTRGELRNGFRAPLADSLNTAFVNNLRARLSAFYEDNDFRVKVTIQDTETYGSTKVNSNNKNSLGVYEAWGEYKFNPSLSAMVGRQILNYDDERILSAGNWANTPNAHDLVRVKYETDKFQAHVGGAWNNAADNLYETYYNESYKAMFYGWAHKKIEKLDVSAIWISEGFQKGETNEEVKTYIFRNTFGANVGMNDAEIPYSFYATGYFQFGYDKLDRKLGTFLLALKNQYKFSSAVTATLGADYYSGSSATLSSKKNHTFNKLYGANHAFNGSMEYWTEVPAQGLIDIYGGAEVKITPKFSVIGSFHTFSTDKKIAGRSKKGIGSEIDLQAKYALSKAFAIEGGWSTYMKNKGTEMLKNQVGVDTRFPHWAYVMISFKPVFFSKKDETLTK